MVKNSWFYDRLMGNQTEAQRDPCIGRLRNATVGSSGYDHGSVKRWGSKIDLLNTQ